MTQEVQLNSLRVPAQQPQELPFLDKIIYKKVNGVALNCFEAIVDWFLRVFSCCCPSYKERLALLSTETPADDLEQANVLYFSDGTPLYDCTAQKIANLITVRQTSLLAQQGENPPPLEFITLLENIPTTPGTRTLFFSADENEYRGFGAAHDTKYVVIKDSNQPGKVEVIERKQHGPSVLATVDRNEYFSRNHSRHSSQFHSAYLTEEAIEKAREGGRRDFYRRGRPHFFGPTPQAPEPPRIILLGTCRIEDRTAGKIVDVGTDSITNEQYITLGGQKVVFKGVEPDPFQPLEPPLRAQNFHAVVEDRTEHPQQVVIRLSKDGESTEEFLDLRHHYLQCTSGPHIGPIGTELKKDVYLTNRAIHEITDERYLCGPFDRPWTQGGKLIPERQA